MNGASANVFIDNLAYRQFLYYDLNISLVDMETAAAALVPTVFCSQFWCFCFAFFLLFCVPYLQLSSGSGCVNYFCLFTSRFLFLCVQVCYEANIPFIAFRSLSDLAGGGTGANQISIFGDLAAENAALFVSSFFKLL
jgi:nucleoside phosphorylase